MAVEKIKYSILLVFCAAFFVAMKRTYLDMLASSRLECGSKILRHLG